MASINYWFEGKNPEWRRGSGVDLSLTQAARAYYNIIRYFATEETTPNNSKPGQRSFSNHISYNLELYAAPDDFNLHEGHIIWICTNELEDLEGLIRDCGLPFDRHKVEDL